MIGGISSTNGYTNSSLPVARDRADSTRTAAARPEANPDQRQGVGQATARGGEGASVPSVSDQDNQLFSRRVEARNAADNARLEPFRADDIPLANLRALQTFAAVAAQDDAPGGIDVELAGVDIRV